MFTGACCVFGLFSFLFLNLSRQLFWTFLLLLLHSFSLTAFACLLRYRSCTVLETEELYKRL